jgi:hypothetical protein
VKLDFRKLFWIIFGIAVFWDCVDFVHNMMKTTEKDSYLTVYDAIDYLVSGIIGDTQYIFYGEALRYLNKLYASKHDQKDDKAT